VFPNVPAGHGIGREVPTGQKVPTGHTPPIENTEILVQASEFVVFEGSGRKFPV
jgi:hypothetical protein